RLSVSLASRCPLVACFTLVVVPLLIRNSHSSCCPIIACFALVVVVIPSLLQKLGRVSALREALVHVLLLDVLLLSAHTM
ncbi:hypothetical protein DEU56DRAFT_828418, partial [Suillus clintonianus]|uniref:uncharacterized protein n=1 Tax=Suillus clintonianus TaxID=1904413 RepID=UPI001B87E9F9